MILSPDKARNFTRNLRKLMRQQKSVSDLCKKIGINRQQFNKYLNGHHIPSNKNMGRISRYFGIEQDALFLDEHLFDSVLDGFYLETVKHLRNQRQFNKFLQEAYDSAEEGRDFVGLYDRYQYSSIYPTKILRSVFYVYDNGPFLQNIHIERFPGRDDPARVDFSFKYHGFCSYLADRLYCYDFETVQRNEMTFAVYAPVHRNSRRFLFGMSSGISATALRQPYTAKSVLHYRKERLDRKEDIQRATVLAADDTAIPREVIDFLNSGTAVLKME